VVSLSLRYRARQTSPLHQSLGRCLQVLPCKGFRLAKLVSSSAVRSSRFYSCQGLSRSQCVSVVVYYQEAMLDRYSHLSNGPKLKASIFWSASTVESPFVARAQAPSL
jgi:hypothetical protein